MILDRVRPKYIYTNSDTSSTREIFVYGANYWDTQKSSHLKCILDGSIYVNAEFFNSTLILCNITNKAVRSTTFI